MKYTIYLIIAVMAVLFATHETYAQAIYDAQGQYRGYAATGDNGVTSYYNASGTFVGSQQSDSNQTNYYGPQGGYRGTYTAPVYIAPNASYTVPRQPPTPPTVKGW